VVRSASTLYSCARVAKGATLACKWGAALRRGGGLKEARPAGSGARWRQAGAAACRSCTPGGAPGRGTGISGAAVPPEYRSAAPVRGPLPRPRRLGYEVLAGCRSRRLLAAAALASAAGVFAASPAAAAASRCGETCRLPRKALPWPAGPIAHASDGLACAAGVQGGPAEFAGRRGEWPAGEARNPIVLHSPGAIPLSALLHLATDRPAECRLPSPA
jgi:hypothetical protein